MKSKWLGLSLLLIPTISLGQSSFVQSVFNQGMIKHGKEIYLQRCVGCHGVNGDGKGEAAMFLDPKPRDFTTGTYKFRSTPLDSLPTDEDLMRTLSKGLTGTSMPSFHLIPEVSRLAVIQYIKTFSDAWQDEDNYNGPLGGAPLPAEAFRSHDSFIAMAKKGRALYVENCLTCHGQEGLGDGEGAEGLEDDWGFAIKPANLTLKSIKSGHSVEDIYRVIMTGIGGTPMPSFKDVISDKEMWDVSAFVLYLRGKGAGMYGDELPISKITEDEI